MKSGTWSKESRIIRRGWLIMVTALAVLVLSGCGQKDKVIETETELKEGQRKAKIQLLSVTGNEITYVEVESEAEPVNESEDGQETEIVSEPEPAQKEMSDMRMPDADESREMPDMNQPGTDENREMPDMEQPEIDGSFGDAAREDILPGHRGLENKNGGANENTVTTYLPVGINVYTDTGKAARFSILEAGDILEVLFETDEDGEELIIGAWMVNEHFTQ